MSRRRLEPEARRAELLDAAVRVLRRVGSSACRVEDITTEAGTAKGNFYRHFSTWDELLVAVRDALLDGYAREVAARIAAAGADDWWEVLDDEARRFVGFQVDLGELHDVAFHGPASRLHPIDRERSAVHLIASLLEAGIADGAFAAIDVRTVAPLMFHLLHGAADEIAYGADREATQRAVTHMLRQALKPA